MSRTSEPWWSRRVLLGALYVAVVNGLIGYFLVGQFLKPRWLFGVLTALMSIPVTRIIMRRDFP